MEKPMNNDELSKVLPEIRREFEFLSSGKFSEYEDRIDKVTKKATDALTSIIDDGTLQMDPENLVKAVEVLTKAKSTIIESRRRLLDTLLKGEVMAKALEGPKKNEGKGNDVLSEYLKAHSLESGKGSAGGGSVFAEIDKELEENENADA